MHRDTSSGQYASGTGRPEGRTPFRSGFVAVLGRPNVGKSTLVNRLVGRKVSIVSDRPQTTRRRIAGVVNLPSSQVILLDLPGFQRPFDELTRRMQAAVEEAIREVDAGLIVLNAAESIGGGDRRVVRAAVEGTTPAVVVLNKVDLVDQRRLTALREQVATLAGGVPVHAVSAKTGYNLGIVMDELVACLPEGPRYFPEEVVSDQPLEVLIAELVREQTLRRTREEVPHAVAVTVEEIVERRDRPLLEVAATIVVEAESQKAIVIGRGGALIKGIGSAARREIEAIVGVQVYLSLRVKVRRKWRREEGSVERFV